MSELIVFLVAFPLIVSGVLLLVTRGSVRNAIVVVACTIVAGAASLITAVTFGNGGAVFFGLPGGLSPGYAVVAMEAAIALFVVIVGIRTGAPCSRRSWPSPSSPSPSTWSSGVTCRRPIPSASSGSTACR